MNVLDSLCPLNRAIDHEFCDTVWSAIINREEKTICSLLVVTGNNNSSFYNNPDHLKWVHITISNTKSFIAGTFHGLNSKHLQSYLNEFCYRFNRRKFKE